MAKEILDIYVEQGFRFIFDMDYNTYDGEDLEDTNDVYFENKSIGKKQFTVLNNTLYLELTESDTNKISSNLESYTIYAIEKLTSIKNKLLSGRIHLDIKGQ